LRDRNERIVAANDRVNAVWTFFWPMVALLVQMGLVVVWAVGIWAAFEQRMTVGALMAALTYSGRIFMRLESMSRIATNTQRAAASAQRSPNRPDLSSRDLSTGRFKSTVSASATEIGR
jgi:ATP-binding cassette subfamily B protein